MSPLPTFEARTEQNGGSERKNFCQNLFRTLFLIKVIKSLAGIGGRQETGDFVKELQ